MKNIIDFLKRHTVWVLIGLVSLFLLGPALTELRTLYFVLTIECLAIAMSGVSAYIYTKIDFTKEFTASNPGLIFLGVHICIGLVILGVYIVQFTS